MYAHTYHTYVSDVLLSGGVVSFFLVLVVNPPADG